MSSEEERAHSDVDDVSSDEAQIELEAYLQMKGKTEGKKYFVNNKSGLLAKYEELRWKDMDWPETFQVKTSLPLELANVENDLQRETAFVELSGSAVAELKENCDKWKIPFERPIDYFAEMIKSDSHMLKIKNNLLHEKRSVEESEERRKQREQKRFGKQVQAEKLKERAKTKAKNMAEADGLRKRMRGGKNRLDDEGMVSGGGGGDDSTTGSKRRRGGDDEEGKGGRSKKRQKDAKFGFGGRKKGSKSNDHRSYLDTSSFSANKNKSLPPHLSHLSSTGSARGGRGGRQAGRGGRGGTSGRGRPGKSRRQRM